MYAIQFNFECFAVVSDFMLIWHVSLFSFNDAYANLVDDDHFMNIMHLVNLHFPIFLYKCSLHLRSIINIIMTVLLYQ